MVRYRLSGPARSDVVDILAASLERWGADGRARYAELFAAAFRAAARTPEGPIARDRSDLLPGARSLHLRSVAAGLGVKRPVHVVDYRVAPDGAIEILRVLHERMDPARRFDQPGERAPAPRRRPR